MTFPSSRASNTPAIPIERGNACLSCRRRKHKCDGIKPRCGSCSLREIGECDYEELAPGEKRKRVSKKTVTELEKKLEQLQEQVQNIQALSINPFQSSFLSTVDAASIYHNSSNEGASTSALLSHGYPLDLPSLPTLYRITSDFLAAPHPVSTMLQHSNLLRRLNLPPSHPEFPYESLLHALISFQDEFYGCDLLGSERTYEEGKRAHWHHSKATERFNEGVSKGATSLDLLHASTLMCHYILRVCAYCEIWTSTGRTSRLCVGLQLNSIPPLGVTSYPSPFAQNLFSKSFTLPPIKDENEDRERRLACWWAIVCDRFVSACTGWSVALQDDDIQTCLPAPSDASLDQETLWRVLSPQSPEFYHLHPRNICGGLQLFFKGMLLLGRSVSIPQRCQVPGNPIKKTPDMTTARIRAGPAFQAIERDLTAYQYSTSTFLVENPNDVFTPIIKNVTLLARILVHEQLCSADIDDPSMTTCLRSAGSIYGSVLEKGQPGASDDALWFQTFAWAVAGRTFVRVYAIRNILRDTGCLEELQKRVSTITRALRSYGNPHADNYALVLDTLQQNPLVALPQIWSALLKSERSFPLNGDILPLHKTVARLGLHYSKRRAAAT